MSLNTLFLNGQISFRSELKASSCGAARLGNAGMIGKMDAIGLSPNLDLPIIGSKIAPQHGSGHSQLS